MDIIEQLLRDEELNVNAADKDQMTALHYATKNGKNEIIDKLLDKGAKIITRFVSCVIGRNFHKRAVCGSAFWFGVLFNVCGSSLNENEWLDG